MWSHWNIASGPVPCPNILLDNFARILEIASPRVKLSSISSLVIERGCMRILLDLLPMAKMLFPNMATLQIGSYNVYVCRKLLPTENSITASVIFLPTFAPKIGMQILNLHAIVFSMLGTVEAEL